MRELFPNNVSRRHSIFLIVFFLNYYRFFNCIVYSIPFFKYSAYVLDVFFAGYFLICAIKCNKTTYSLFEKSVNYIYIMIFVGLLVGIFDGQYVDYAIKWVARSWLLWGIYYYFRIHKLPINYALSLLKYLLLGSVVATIISTLQFPNSWFGMSGEDAVGRIKESLAQRGVLRFNIPGKVLIVLFLFKEVQNFVFSPKNILRLGLMMVFLVMIGNRFPIAVCLFMILVLILVSRSIKIKHKIQIALCVTFLCATIFIIPATRNIISKLVTLTERGGVNGVSDENIRVLSATYFFTEFNAPDDNYHIIMGNGIGFPNSGKYADKLTYLQDTYHFFVSDVGYSAIFIYFGIFGLFIFFYWLISGICINSSRQYNYIKHFFIFVTISMICGGYWFEYFPEISMMSYMLVKSNHLLLKKAV